MNMQNWTWSLLGLSLLGLACGDNSRVTEFAVPDFGAAGGIVGGPDGNIWFTDWVRGGIGRLTSTGTVSLFPLPDPGSSPMGIAAGPDGNLWLQVPGGPALFSFLPGEFPPMYPSPCAMSTGRLPAPGSIRRGFACRGL